MVDMSRTLDELVSSDSAWPILLQLFSESPHDVRVVEADEAVRADALIAAQVTTHSMLGALVWNCAAVAIDYGWVRLVGAGVGDLEGAHAEQLNDPEGDRVFDGVVVAYDVLGGRFVIHGKGLDVPPGEVVYWAPDSLAWRSIGRGHSAMVDFLLSDRLADFYADLRWPGWEADVDPIAIDQGLTAYPFAWSAEGKGPNVHRKPAPMAEVIGVAEHAASQLRGHPDGTPFEIKFT